MTEEDQDIGKSASEGKGRPTPKRRDQEAANRRPLISDDRKVAKQQNKQAVAEERARMRRALDTGEEKYLPARDKGPQRRFVRDFVDARWGIGEWLIIGVLIFLGLSFVPTPAMQMASTIGMLTFVFLVILEGFWVGFQVKKRLEAKFGAMEPGCRWYAAMRSTQMRRMRLPRPQVKRGQFPD
ncbi:hypothetical protein GCM10009720_14030 [Yaniella flava]|uniref:DUF3043 domain-containing protein n=1 Tax=Yaniella flava TaxID=287930 RepID=A0ABN2UDH0_9MICC